jgi:hypothetical protein
MKSQAQVHLVKERIMLKLAKHAIAIAVVVAAATAPVAARAEMPTFSYTQLAVTHTVQDDRDSSAAQPR